MKLPEKLKALRSSSGTTQSQIAKAAGVSVTQYQNYEYGKSEPTAEVLAALAAYFDAPIDYLVGKGIYSKADIILEHWDIFRKQLSLLFAERFPGISSTLDSRDLPDMLKLQLVDALISDIEFSDDHLKLEISWKV